MAKPKKKNIGSKLLFLVKSRPILTLLLVGLVGILGYALVLVPLQVKQEKQRFLNARDEIRKVAEEIEATIGSADQKVNKDSCTYASRKFDKGPLSCVVGDYLLYEGVDAMKASQFMKDASSVSRSSVRHYQGDAISDFLSLVSDNSFEIFYQDYETIELIPCSISYQYTLSASAALLFQNPDTKSLLIDISCSSSANTEHFPLSNN